ncbi:bifunctional 4-hydroxy-2-oxoglutarate aldolase/2-dehydro-3-deoxy-phosphogluconate aldolase, partial [Microbacteriaceae bacterium VKM Ac-2854]|nr:bifunctional 4-hydroxy-2-oxoglutarate aldolase/2-dehydro-3-deoxy-phosphogluconate aldolase [Microbacteriaceae bacterium VKM Ac-2854]
PQTPHRHRRIHPSQPRQRQQRPRELQLARGGMPVVELTLRTPGALDALAALSDDDRLIVGAGTVLTPAQVDLAVAAGARFLVSPGLSRATVERAAEHGVPIIPGTATATEVMAARELGLSTVKFFPAETSGGAAAVRSLSAVFPGTRFMPTGGIGSATLGSYLAIPSVIAVGGSWMVPRDRITAGDHDAIRDLASDALQLATRR